MPWQYAFVIMVATSVATSLVQRHYAQKSHVPVTIPSAASYLFGVLPVGLFAGFFIFPHQINWSWWLVLLLAVCGSCIAISGALGFRVAGHLPVAANMTINKITGITTVLLGWVMLGEGLTDWRGYFASSSPACNLGSSQKQYWRFPAFVSSNHTTCYYCLRRAGHRARHRKGNSGPYADWWRLFSRLDIANTSYAALSG
jgi:hypothetical protein